jgi:hypothetical protein
MGYLPVIKIHNSHVKKYIYDKGKVVYHEIDAILLSSNYILHCSIYKKDIERLNQKVKKNK